MTTEQFSLDYPLLRTLQAFQRHIPPILASPSVLENITSTLQALPLIQARDMQLECHLGSQGTRTDIAFGINPEEDPVPGKVLADIQAGIAANPALHENPVWQRIAQLAHQWADPENAFFANLFLAWLEFDIATEGSGLPIPSIFVGAKPELPTQLRHETILNALRVLRARPESDFDTPLPEPLNSMLAKALASIPDHPEIKLRWIGTMPARSGDFLRLAVRGMNIQQVTNYLQINDWKYDLDEWHSVVDKVHAIGNATLFSFDVTPDGIGPRLALECFYGPPLDALIKKTFQLLDYFVEIGICSPEERDAVVGWKGYGLDRLTHISYQHALSRRLNHLKIIYQPGQPLEAKAYLRMYVVRI